MELTLVSAAPYVVIWEWAFVISAGFIILVWAKLCEEGPTLDCTAAAGIEGFWVSIRRAEVWREASDLF